MEIGVMVWDNINNFLAIIGLISLIITVVRTIWVLTRGKEWIDNIKIEEYPLTHDFDTEKGYYPQFYPENREEIEGEYATQNLFVPQGVLIRNAKIKKVVLSENRKGETKYKYKKVYKVKEISPRSPLCLIIERTHCIPRYKIEWKTEYGGKAEYYFGDNMRNGDNSLSGIKYKFGFFAKVRKIIGLM